MTKHENNTTIKYYRSFVAPGRALKQGPVHLCGHNKKRHLHALRRVSFMYNPEVPFGLELTAERLMAERKRKGYLLTSNTKLLNHYIKNCTAAIGLRVVGKAYNISLLYISEPPF